MKSLQFKVEKIVEDSRLDKIIPLHLPEISRSRARALIENGSVYVDKKRCHKNAKTVNLGQQVQIHISEKPAATESATENSEVPSIVFENADWIVVNKPPFLPTHETLDTSRYHLALWIQETLAKREKKNKKDIYLGIHHRLDRDTSGIILFSKRKEANAALANAFQEREVEKTYLALCQGKLEGPLTLKSFMGDHPKNKRRQCSVKSGGRYAETLIRPIQEKKLAGKTYTLVEARPKTGRTHQIRVHLSENDLPILGDETYGVKHPAAKRVLLHAWKLEILGKTFTAPPPSDFQLLDFQIPGA